MINTRLILFFCIFFFQSFLFSQEFEEINVKSTKEKIDSLEKKQPHLHPRANFPVMVGCKATVIGKQFFIGSKLNWQYAFKENKRHKIGLVTDFLFAQNSISDNSTHTYTNFFGDTISREVNHFFTLIHFCAQYDYYALVPNVRGLGLRTGLSFGLSIQDSNFDLDYNKIRLPNAGFLTEFTIGIEYRFESNFGFYVEASGGYYKFSKKLVYMPYYQNFIASFSAGILFDFTIIKKD